MIRSAFVDVFGEDDARAIERAAIEHSNGINDDDRGTDTFKWALCIALGYQCMEIDGYREHHGIVSPWLDLKAWIIEHAQLEDHDGDVDYIALLGGVYDEYVEAGG